MADVDLSAGVAGNPTEPPEQREAFARLARLSARAAGARLAIIGVAHEGRFVAYGWHDAQPSLVQRALAVLDPALLAQRSEISAGAAAGLATSELPGSTVIAVRHQDALVGVLVLGFDGTAALDIRLAHDLSETVASELLLATRDLIRRDNRRQAETRYRHLFETSRDPIYMTSRDGRFQDVNQAMIDLFGYTREELMARRAEDLYAESAGRGRFHEEIERAGFVREHEAAMRRRDGSQVICLETASVDRALDGRIIGHLGILHDITERKRAESQLVHSAFHDPLTGLPNRALFIDRLERLLRYSRRHREYRFAVMFMDLDRFKQVNDGLGHGVGDQLLISIARRLEGSLRQEDTVARLGGDEFGIIIDAIQDAPHATRVAARVLNEMQVPFIIGGHNLVTGSSIGIALSLTGYTNVEQMIRDADAAMYRAKSAGRNRYEVFDTAMHERAVAQFQLEGELRRAVQNGQLALQYLPVFSLADRQLSGLEALIRWQHPERGLLMPAEFIPAAEDSGLIVPLGWWVLRHACDQLTDWERSLGELAQSITVSVNLSGRQFLQPDLIATIDRILRDTGVSTQRLRLEIAEQDVMRNADASLNVLNELHRRGIQLSIDDFGTGYSSLSYLQRFPVDAFKIDRSFVRMLGNGDTGPSVALVRSILALGSSMAIPAIAEGVETEAQLAHLQRLGVQYAQGYVFSEPIDAAALPQLLGLNKEA